MENKDQLKIGVVGLICTVLSLLWIWMLSFKYIHFGYYDWDLAFFSQACWNLLHGSQYVSLVGINYFGDHSYFFTFLILPFFAIFPHPLTLVVLKVLAFAVSAFLLFRVCHKDLGFKVSLGLMLAYILFPPNIFTLLYEFNPESFAPPFIILIFDSFRRRKWKIFWVSAIALMLIKENLILVTMAFWAFAWITEKDRVSRRHATALLILSSVVFYLFTIVLIPHFRHLDHHAFIVRYAYLGSSFGEIIRNILVNPSLIASHLFYSGNQSYLLEQFGCWLPMSFLGYPVLLVVSPILLQHLLSSHAAEHSIYYHYGMTISVFIFLAVHKGLSSPNTKNSRVMSILVKLFILISILSTIHYRQDFWLRSDNHQDALTLKRWDLINAIPKDVGVIATFDFLAPLSTRQELYSLHKIYDESFQNPMKIAKSELNTNSTFSLPQSVSYALIDFNDLWLIKSMSKNPAFTKERLDLFLVGWRVIGSAGSTKLYVRR